MSFKLLPVHCMFLLAAVSIAAAAAPEDGKPATPKPKGKQKLTTSTVSVSEVWLGTAPLCKASPANCQLFDLEFVREDASGNGAACWTGKKVLCRQKPLSVDLVASALNELVVGVYNVHEPPFAQEHSGQTERTCHIPRALLNRYPDLDIIILVDLFIGGCMQHSQSSPPLSMGHMFANYGFAHATNIVGEAERPFYSTNGGTVIVSRWPIISSREMVFTNYAGLERLVGKGAVYAGINKRGFVYHVVGTQLQAGSDGAQVRLDQAGELAAFISDLELPSRQPVIIGGDFKVDWLNSASEAKKLMKAMFAEMPIISGEVRANVDFRSNELVVPEVNPQEWLDYALYSTRHLPANKANLESSHLTADQTVSYCSRGLFQPTYLSPTTFGCGSEQSTRQLSDHYPVVGRFVFNSDQSKQKQFQPPLSNDEGGGGDEEEGEETEVESSNSAAT